MEPNTPVAPTYPFLIPASEIEPAREGWVEVLKDFPISWEVPITLQPGFRIALAIKSTSVGFVLINDARTAEPYNLDCEFFAFHREDLKDFYFPGSSLLPYEDGASDVVSIVRHVLLKHLKPRVFISPHQGGEKGEVEISLEITDIGNDVPSSPYTEYFSVRGYMEFAEA